MILAGRQLIPKPKSNFLKVKCSKCGNEQTVFSGTTMSIKCNVCEETLAEPTGGTTEIKGEVVQVLG